MSGCRSYPDPQIASRLEQQPREMQKGTALERFRFRVARALGPRSVDEVIAVAGQAFLERGHAGGDVELLAIAREGAVEPSVDEASQ